MSRDPLTRLAEFTVSPFAALRAVRSGRANGLVTLPPKGTRASVYQTFSPRPFGGEKVRKKSSWLVILSAAKDLRILFSSKYGVASLRSA
jgi:hypothetical protein